MSILLLLLTYSNSHISSKMAPYVIKYFGLPALGEPIRILLHLGKMEWEDVIVTGETWPAMKPNTKWGQVPVLTTPSGKEMTQSKAMTRYLGKLVSFEGSLTFRGAL